MMTITIIYRESSQNVGKQVQASRRTFINSSGSMTENDVSLAFLNAHCIATCARLSQQMGGYVNMTHTYSCYEYYIVGCGRMIMNFNQSFSILCNDQDVGESVCLSTSL